MKLIKIQRLEHRLADVFGIIASIILALVMASTTLDATSRTLLKNPLPGVYEFSGIAMGLMVFLGLFWTQIDGKHIRVNIIAQLSRGQSKGNALSCFSWLACAFFLGIAFFPTAEGAWQSFQIREFQWGLVQMPIWWAKILIALSTCLAFLQMLLHATRAFNSCIKEC